MQLGHLGRSVVRGRTCFQIVVNPRRSTHSETYVWSNGDAMRLRTSRSCTSESDSLAANR